MPDDFAERFRLATEALQSGAINPELEEISPHRSDAWCRAQGWADAIAEEAMEAGD